MSAAIAPLVRLTEYLEKDNKISDILNTYFLLAASEKEQAESHVDGHVGTVSNFRSVEARMKLSDKSHDAQVAGTCHNLRKKRKSN